MTELRYKLLTPLAKPPLRATEGSAGLDLSAAMEQPVTLRHGKVVSIPTGIAIELEPGCAGLVLGRSGLGIKHGVCPANAVGLIDSDYRGELRVGLVCNKEGGYTIEPGERIAQLVIIPVCMPTLTEAAELTETARGENGFGSTGSGSGTPTGMAPAPLRCASADRR